jgi:hypothetical protein
MLIDAFPNNEPQIVALVKTISELKTDRNEILHWTWIPGLEPGTAIASTARPFREFRYSELCADQIQVIADDMLVVSKALMEWQSAFHQRPNEPSSEKA